MGDCVAKVSQVLGDVPYALQEVPGKLHQDVSAGLCKWEKWDNVVVSFALSFSLYPSKQEDICEWQRNNQAVESHTQMQAKVVMIRKGRRDYHIGKNVRAKDHYINSIVLHLVISHSPGMFILS